MEIVSKYTIAVLIPCYNEQATIGSVIGSFRQVLPMAAIYVYDNNSTDETLDRAIQAGATTRSESHQGKGNVIRRKFSDIEADIYVLVDGDGTYDVASAPALIAKLCEERLDMVVGTRVATDEASRRGRRFGNDLLTGFVGMLFGRVFTDMLSGYRVFSPAL